MSFTVQTIINRLPSLLSGRQVAFTDAAEWTRKTVLELTEDYPFPALEVPGSQIALTAGQAIYSLNYFYPVSYLSNEQTEINRIVSIFFFSNSSIAPLPLSSTGANPGYNLIYRTFDSIQIELNISGIPVHWSRFNDNYYITYVPNAIYYVQPSFQQEHPFPNAGTINAGNDPILMPNSWQDIVEYCTAARAAKELRLNDIERSYRVSVYGDPKFQLTGGTEGAPGLIFMRTSQNQRDQTSAGAAKYLKLYNRPYQKR
jgi:hypothetical protein